MYHPPINHQPIDAVVVGADLYLKFLEAPSGAATFDALREWHEWEDTHTALQQRQATARAERNYQRQPIHKWS